MTELAPVYQAIASMHMIRIESALSAYQKNISLFKTVAHSFNGTPSSKNMVLDNSTRLVPNMSMNFYCAEVYDAYQNLCLMTVGGFEFPAQLAQEKSALETKIISLGFAKSKAELDLIAAKMSFER